MLALLSGLFAQLFAEGALYYVAMKAVLVTLIMVILPIVLTNFFSSIVTGIISIVNSHTGSLSSTTVSLTGLAGYLADGLGLPGCFAVIVSAVATRFALKLIPFVRL